MGQAASAQPHPEDGRSTVEALRARVNELAGGRARTGDMRRAVRSASELTQPRRLNPATELPVAEELLPLLPPSWGGLRRGATIAVPAAASVLLTLAGGAMSRGGVWSAAVGLPTLGLASAVESYHVDLARLALIPEPGPDWARIVAGLLDGIEVVLLGTPPEPVSAPTARGLAARARQRGGVLLVTTAQWPATDLTLQAAARTYTGLGRGWGYLAGQQTTITSTGRGSASRPRSVTTAMPPPSLTALAGQHRPLADVRPRPLSDAEVTIRTATAR